MKVYIELTIRHVPVTFACDVINDDTTLNQLKQAILKQTRQFEPNLSSHSLNLYRNGKEIVSAQDSKISQLVTCNELLSASLVKSNVVASLESATTGSKPNVKAQANDVRKQYVNLSVSATSSETSEQKTVADWIKIAKKWLKSGFAKKSVEIYKLLLNAGCATEDIYTDLIHIFRKAERPHIALKYAKSAKKKFPENIDFLLSEGECCLQLERADKALELYMDASKQLRGSKLATVQLKHAIQTGMCKAYQLKQETDMALVLIQGVVRENRQNLPAMIEYAKLTYDLGDLQASEAAVILLTCLVQEREDVYRQKTLTDMCKKAMGVQYLLRAMEDARRDAAALGFLASVLRDYGALDESIELLQLALKYKPDHVNIFLHYIHTLEVLGRHEHIVEQLLTFLETHAAFAVGSVTNQQVFDCVKHLRSEPLYLNSTGGDCEGDDVMDQLITSYSDEDLYLLAVWFTLVKVVHVRGALSTLPRLTALLDPLYEGKDLHLTLIKNEAAYYACISKVVSTWRSADVTVQYDIPSVSRESRFVHLVGDSHCIPPAWRCIKYKDQDHVIHPHLSTGTKIWHLRPEGVFYPKANFWNELSSIKDGSAVIFLLGEIDCREGLHYCVQKCKYDTIEEGIERLIDIYLTLLEEEGEKHGWEVYVHPVPPVLDITRSTVMAFNTRVKQRLESSARLSYLDILPHITDGDGTLHSHLEFDGTHLHPQYTSHLEKALAQ